MTAEHARWSPLVQASDPFDAHPLSPLTASEIKKTAHLIRGLWPTGTSLQFKTITLEEPEKARLVPYLEAEHAGKRLPKIERKAFICYCIRNTVSLSNTMSNVDSARVYCSPNASL